MSEENSTKHKIELTIRCALQTFNDRTIECPLDWTVLQLKQHLYKICSSKPEISRQRLIYAGHCLDNDQTIGSVLRRDEKGGDSCSEAPQVIHLVCVNKEMLSGSSSSSSSRTANSNELRQRHNVANTVPLPNNNNNVPLNPQQFQYMPNSPEAYQNYLNQIAIQQQLLGAYNPNLYYNPYDQQQHAHFLNSMMMASVMGAGWPQQQQLMPFGGGYGFQPAQPFMFAGGPTGGMLMGGPAGDALLPFQPNNNQFQQQQVVNLPAPPANNNNNDEQQPDFLALIYKSIRFALLMMVLYLYSSIERFFAAIFLIGLVWFVQQRRHQNRVEQPPAPIVPPGETTETPNDNNNNNANTPNQEVAMGGANLAPPPPSNNRPPQSFSAWNVFWSTVTSFFASLIPENPQVPVNIN